ncbi:MAG: sigma-70 family RNA polymerase sigma factor [Acidobacteriota bacterium]
MRLSTQDLEGLLGRVQSGDLQARQSILVFLQARLLPLAKRRVAEADAEDLLQETLLVFDAELDRITSPEAVLAFAHQVLRNKIGNYYRKRDRRRVHHVDYEAAPEPSATIDADLEVAELERVLVRALARLGEKRPRCRQIFDGIRAEKEIKEIALQLGIPRARVDDRLYRCRRALKEILRDEFGIRL